MKVPHPPWYRTYPRATNIIWLTAIIIRHAELFTYAAQKIREIEAEEAQREVDRNGDDDASMGSDDSVASDVSFSVHLNSGSLRVFKMPGWHVCYLLFLALVPEASSFYSPCSDQYKD